MKKILIIVLILFVVTSAYLFRRPLFGSLHSVIQNPQKTYQLEIYSYPLPFAMPGQGSDAPGFIYLRRLSDGAVIQRTDVEMVQQATQPRWSSNTVEIKLIAEWELR